MLDSRLRPLKERLTGPLAARLAPRTAAALFTAGALGAGLGAGLAAASGAVVLSLVLWWSSRIADGLDGPVARRRGEASDLGGYLDLLGDTVVYAAIPIGVAVASGQRSTWIAVAVLLCTFYVNTVSWMYLSAVLEKRRSAGAAPERTTSIVMPAGLIEGTETIVLYSLLLATPGWAVWWAGLMAVLVVVTVAQRVWWARRHLR
jgi:phosphatidylglycerophosphate synthase